MTTSISQAGSSMTYYHTDKSTGEMIPVLAGLKQRPTYKVHRLRSPHIPARMTTNRAPYNRRRRPSPLNDCLSGLAAVVTAFAVLTALT